MQLVKNCLLILCHDHILQEVVSFDRNFCIFSSLFSIHLCFHPFHISMTIRIFAHDFSIILDISAKSFTKLYMVIVMNIEKNFNGNVSGKSGLAGGRPGM